MSPVFRSGLSSPTSVIVFPRNVICDGGAGWMERRFGGAATPARTGGGGRSSLVTRQELHERFELRPGQHIPESLGHDADELLVALGDPRVWFEFLIIRQPPRPTRATMAPSDSFTISSRFSTA